ncbi:DUF2861 family protein [Photobacterium sp. J15]|uniref:DUF2861 family protein n=1 Tax=Photobacterium sp. J15 TaxID=265901 RepID=UPI0007E3D96A|nr:DUF2861 family protein [Photobacterium sp. J15]
MFRNVQRNGLALDHLALLGIVVISSSAAKADDWLMPTPLKPTYEALLNQQSILAWQELQMMLGRDKSLLDSKLWEDAFDIILEQSNCGKQLTNQGAMIANETTDGIGQITVSLISRANINYQAKQLKVSIDGTPDITNIELSDMSGKQWLKGNNLTPDKDGYLEVETEDGGNQLPSGLYRLKVNDRFFPIILAPDDEDGWVKFNSHSNAKGGKGLFNYSLPEGKTGCSKPLVMWQWLDEDFNTVAPTESVTFSHNDDVILPERAPEGGQWLSSIVSQKYYQGEIAIRQDRRLTIPVSVFQQVR